MLDGNCIGMGDGFGHHVITEAKGAIYGIGGGIGADGETTAGTKQGTLCLHTGGAAFCLGASKDGRIIFPMEGDLDGF